MPEQRQPTYSVLRHVGQGATGHVFALRRLSDGEPYALKIVDMEPLSDTDRKRAMSEVTCLLNCNYFSIIRCHEDLVRYSPENITKAQMLALVLDYADKGDLRGLIRRREKENNYFQEEEIGLYFIQIVLALHHVHSKRMLHRDIKSANILLCGNGLVKLGDFGFSQIYDVSVSNETDVTFCGTPFYVAPEVWERRPYSKKADMFSLGVLLYEMMALKRPFRGARSSEVMNANLKGVYDPLPTIFSEELRTIVDLLLNRKPESRPSTSQLLETSFCKHFLDILLTKARDSSILPSKELRNSIRDDIKRTRESLGKKRVRYRLPPFDSTINAHAQSSALSQSSVGAPPTEDIAKEGPGPLSKNSDPIGGDILAEGTLQKLSSNNTWKNRYLSIRYMGRKNDDLGRARNLYNLVLGINKQSLGNKDQVRVTRFDDLEDVFQVPPRFANNENFAFAVVFKNGNKRFLFKVQSADYLGAWIQRIREALGLTEFDDDEYEQNQ